MRVKLVTLRYAAGLGGFDDRPLADFVRDKDVLAVREHFFAVHDLPHLACLVTYQERVDGSGNDASSADRPSRRGKRPNPVLELDEKGRALYETLREWRVARARKEGVPPFVILNNRELVDVIKAAPQTPSALTAIEGIGEAKVERYGKAILDLLHGTRSA